MEVGSGEGALPPPQQINITFAEINVLKSKKNEITNTVHFL